MKKILTAILSVAMACGIGIAAVGCAGGYAIEVGGGGSGVGISGAKDGSLDLGMASKEVDGAEEGLSVYTLCKDGIAVIVHNDNAVDDLTLEELKAIYTGETSNWSEVGGNDAEIVLIGREAGSGTRDGFESITETEDACKYRQELTSTGDVITTVAGNPDAIGYASMASVDDSVKTLSVDGVTPSELTVKDGSYVVQRPFVLVTKTDEALSDTAQKFFDYITSSDASEIISEAGAVPVN